ncbi:unnamed protein product [Arabidopsis thaliana]|uniref:Defensin-like protein 50 n=2 Tax=Arabidopsis thaliana TaxID=3702 RepID=DEF50_ARATH|nr:low-molecular-weight cysteine-rich 49 [Arabidopsis thaliana]P82764.1 RecName: Full=Defensin-like protein 50; AltName: Full=Low-molecular-weight cysteine-rich protein 49; Short=Protein LCR49; Flags: Precursor [Arabidopsis thaliana]AEC08803.1 low-molecular-weight cysteine-rich 49 [Arabidopsis thaliana]CAA0374308.1 unnamed protein product [Arabidopsis thaliana]VYS54297.1 unnamed protein product [Arabidopsis thaliana]|eukprot:NP_001031470.1 low-molecular-weight cysteine-rich 49 [Arabidopsis thaliana]
MGFTKIVVTFFLVVMLAVSSSSQNAMASEIKAKINGLECFNTCTPYYDDYKCNVDCLSSGYPAGDCHIVSPSQPKKCCCY